jgi:hypothetical protein
LAKKRQNPRRAPIDRFTWWEGDLRIIHDPREDPIHKADADLDDARQTEPEERNRRKDA